MGEAHAFIAWSGHIFNTKDIPRMGAKFDLPRQMNKNSQEENVLLSSQLLYQVHPLEIIPPIQLD